MKKVVMFFDTHFGWEKSSIGGKHKTLPTHDIRVFNAALKFVKDFKPDIFIMGGDNHNMSFISRHNRGKPRLVEGFSAKREYNESDRQIITPLENILPKGCDKIWMLGNHEYWVEVFLNENPSLTGIIEPQEYLRLHDRGWKIIDYGGVVKLGKLNVIHGDTIRSAAKYRAARILEQYGRSVASGHAHTAQIHVSTSMADGDSHISYIIPMMGNPNPAYQSNAPNNSVQGFGYAYILPNGNFNLYPVIVSNSQFVAEGKEYRG